MDTIPNELLIKIIDEITDYDLLPLRAVSKQWRSVVDDIKVKRRNAFSKAIRSCNLVWKGLTAPDQELGTREIFASATHGKFIYIFGGENGHNELYSFDLSTYKWRCIEASGNLPGPRDCSLFVVFKSKLLVFGGCCDGKYLDDTYIFDTNSEQWNEVPCEEGGCPTACVSASGSVVGHLVVMFGGSTIGRYLNDVWLFNTRTLRWSICDMHGEKPPSSACHSQFTIRESKIIVCGGFKIGLDIWLLDISEKCWTKLRVDSTSLAPVESYFYSPVLIDEHIVVLGPGLSDDKFIQHMHVLDCTKVESALSCEWIIYGPLMPLLPTRRLFTASAGKGEIVLFGGEDQMTGKTIGTTCTIVINGKPSVWNRCLTV